MTTPETAATDRPVLTLHAAGNVTLTTCAEGFELRLFSMRDGRKNVTSLHENPAELPRLYQYRTFWYLVGLPTMPTMTLPAIGLFCPRGKNNCRLALTSSPIALDWRTH